MDNATNSTMATEKRRITVNLSDEDYQWIVTKANLTGNSRAAVLRQMVRALRLEKPELLPFENDGDGIAAEENSEQDTGAGAPEGETREIGLNAFSTE